MWNIMGQKSINWQISLELYIDLLTLSGENSRELERKKIKR